MTPPLVLAASLIGLAMIAWLRAALVVSRLMRTGRLQVGVAVDPTSWVVGVEWQHAPNSHVCSPVGCVAIDILKIKLAVPTGEPRRAA